MPRPPSIFKGRGVQGGDGTRRDVAYPFGNFYQNTQAFSEASLSSSKALLILEASVTFPTASTALRASSSALSRLVLLFCCDIPSCHPHLIKEPTTCF